MRLHIIYIVVVLFAFGGVACSSSPSKSTVRDESPESSAQKPEPSAQKPEKVAQTAVFDVDTAMAFLKRQVDFGPRVPGTSSHKRCADFLAATLRGFGAKVTDTPAATVHPVDGTPIEVRNVFAQFNPEATDRILILAHYDTRPWADEDPDPANRNKPIDGANDGASGVAVALEVARHTATLAPGKGLDVLFVDWEDSGNSGSDDTWCIGSTYWANNLPYTSAAPKYGILLDMVGGPNAVFYREYFSEIYASSINDIVWAAAASTPHANRFKDGIGGAINDDHLPLLRAGIPTIDIIEMTPSGFNPTWHTMQDSYDNIDPATIKAVGDVLMKIIY